MNIDLSLKIVALVNVALDLLVFASYQNSIESNNNSIHESILTTKRVRLSARKGVNEQSKQIPKASKTSKTDNKLLKNMHLGDQFCTHKKEKLSSYHRTNCSPTENNKQQYAYVNKSFKLNNNKTISNQKNKKKKKKKEKKGKVFLDSREEMLHEKLIENMLFKPLENNSISIMVSDESKITEDNIKQAMEGKDGSYIAIPAKRKKDIYEVFFKWAHEYERNETKRRLQNEIHEKYKKLFLKNDHNHSDQQKNFTMIAESTDYKYNGKTKNALTFSKNLNNSQNTNHAGNRNILKKFDSMKNTKIFSTSEPTKESKEQHKYRKRFKEESVEFQFDPDYLSKLYNTPKSTIKKSKKTKTKPMPALDSKNDNSEEDYSEQENFMLHTQKEAMGRRFYMAFVNKSASDFWDNTTLETTKMLEILLPLGKHLHETLDKVPPNEGKHFIENMQIYKTELEKFIRLVKMDKAETRPDVVEVLEEPYDHFCETLYNEDEIKIMFGWDDETFFKFEKLFKEIRDMWFDLQLFHNCYQFVSESNESVSNSNNCSNFHEQNYTERID